MQLPCKRLCFLKLGAVLRYLGVRPAADRTSLCVPPRRSSSVRECARRRTPHRSFWFVQQGREVGPRYDCKGVEYQQAFVHVSFLNSWKVGCCEILFMLNCGFWDSIAFFPNYDGSGSGSTFGWGRRCRGDLRSRFQQGGHYTRARVTMDFDFVN